MIGQAEEKVLGGKLLRIKVDYNEKINSVHITGDFFLHPEDSVDQIEALVVGTSVNEEESKISEKIKSYAKGQEIQMIGIDADAIARVVKAAMR